MNLKQMWTAALLVAGALVLGACGGQSNVAASNPTAATQSTATTAQAAAPTPTVAPTATGTPVVEYVGKFQLSPASGPIGSDVKGTGTGFAANADLTVSWQNVVGSWNVNRDDGTYHGEQYDSKYVPLGTVHTDANGDFTTSFKVPDGFGFAHDVVITQGDTVRNKAGFNVEMHVTVSPQSGPVGTPITITADGVGWQYLYNVWQVVYDNKFTGWMSAVSTQGKATVVIPATGDAGTHVVQVTGGIPNFPYLNTPQSPTPDRPVFTFTFDVTSGDPVLPAPAAQQGLPSAAAVAVTGSGPSLTVSPASGPIDTPITIKGTGFTVGQQLDLQWFRVVGNRMSGSGWAENSTSLGKVTASADGTFSLSLKALDDLGGGHHIDAIADDKATATTKYTVTPSIFEVTPDSAAAGQPITVHLKGVGWTETANIYTLVYDNAYLGYACGFNSQGDVTIQIPAAGAPGWHFIDLYPAIYKGVEIKGIETFRLPQLTWQDHPNEELPAFHFAVFVTGGSSN